MTQFNVTGMSCAACATRIEKAVNNVAGVSECAVSLLTNSMGVDGTASPDDIIKAVKAAGYGASLKNGKSETAKADSFKDSEEMSSLKKRLWWSVGLLSVLMYFSMGHMMWGWPLPPFMENNHIAMGLVQLLLTTAVMVINERFFISGFNALKHRAPNMDTLVALGAAAAYIYSTYALFAMTAAEAAGDMQKVMHYMMNLYYESAAMILTLITVGKTLEARSKGKTTDALKGLIELKPDTAVLLKDGKEQTVRVETVCVGDLFVCRPGERIPVDGVVVEGTGAVDESALTGESIPIDKAVGSVVSAGCVNQSGFLKCRATRIGEDTTLSGIIKMVGDAAATKAPIAKIADKVSGVFVPIVIAIAAVTTLAWILLGREVGFALARGISVLVISCPCALGLATPVAIMVGSGIGAKNGILFKTAAALEETGRIEIVALDKTGTITSGKPTVTDVLPSGETNTDELAFLAASLEAKSEHPLAHAITEYAKENGIKTSDVSDFKAMPGNGLFAKFEGEQLIGGNAEYIQKYVSIPKELKSEAVSLSECGKTPMYFCYKEKMLGVIAVADVIREDSKKAIKELKAMGIHTVMLTGDNERTAKAIGKLSGVDCVIAGVMPNEKEEEIRRLESLGKTAMVGDGINDAPALTRADVGIAIGAGTDIAIDAADVVLMKSQLKDVPAAIRLSRATLRNIHENLFWAFFYNTIGIPLAAGLFIPLGLTLNPMFGAAAMSLSSFCVVTNALRLNLFKVYNPKSDRKTKHQNKNFNETIKSMSYKNETKPEENSMKKTMKIEGMMCGHCEATVKNALESISEVANAEVNHTNGTAVVTLNSGAEDEVLKKAVEDKGYRVTAIL